MAPSMNQKVELLRSIPPLLITESQDQFASLCEELEQEIQPKGVIERTYVHDIASIIWEIQRFRRFQTVIINSSCFGRFASPKDEVTWIMLHYFGSTLWKGRPKFAVDPLPAMPSQEPQRTAEAMRRILPELVKLRRYESRAVMRRDRAIRAIALRCK